MAPLSEEEEIYVRLSLLLNGVAPRAVRTYFDREFPPTYLPSTLNKNYNTLHGLFRRRILTQPQWNLLFPKSGIPDARTFDVTLMICLIRNLTSISYPIKGFDSLPLPNETNPESDLARIKYFRIELDRHDSNKRDTAYYNTAWHEISQAVGRLGGQSMYQECQELKVKILDQSNQEVMLEIKQSKEEIREMEQTIHSLGTETSNVKENLRTLHSEHSRVARNLKEVQDAHSTLLSDVADTIKMFKDPIPMNIRELHKNMVETWTLADANFAETNASRRLLSAFSQQDTNVVTITGPRGSGKSFLTQHIAIKMQEDYRYVIIPIDSIEQVIEWFDSERKQLFVLDIDNACYEPSLLDRILKKSQNYSTGLQTKLNDESHKMIACCSTDTYENPKFEKISLLRQHKFDLKADDNILSDEEREMIATRYMKKDDVVALKAMMETFKKLDNFPMLCRQYADEKHENPVRYFSENMSIMNENQIERSITTEDNDTPTSMTSTATIAQQTVEGMFTNTTFNHSPVFVNLTINTISKN